MVLLCRADHFSGMLISSGGGAVFWVKRGEMLQYKRSIDFIDMLKGLKSNELSEFYDHNSSGEWAYSPL